MLKMEKNLEDRLKNLRIKIIGRNLTEKYYSGEDPLQPTQDVTTLDLVKIRAMIVGKSLIPVYGEKILLENERITREIRPMSKDMGYLRDILMGLSIGGKYASLSLFGLYAYLRFF